MIPNRYAPLLFAVVLGGFMTLIVSGITTMLNVGLVGDFLWRWLRAWIPSWGIAFPVLLVARPAVARLVERLTRA